MLFQIELSRFISQTGLEYMHAMLDRDSFSGFFYWNRFLHITFEAVEVFSSVFRPFPVED